MSDTEDAPTAEQVRHGCVWAYERIYPGRSGEATGRRFDLFLAEYTRQVREQVAREIEAVSLDGLAMHANTARAVTRYMVDVARGTHS